MKKIKKLFQNKMFVGIFCILLAVVFSIISANLKIEREEQDVVSALIATQDISVGDKITESMLTEFKLIGKIPKNIITVKEDVIGKYAKNNIPINDIITVEKLSQEAVYGSAYLENLEKNQRAISVSLNSLAVGLSGKLESGDIVSVIVVDEDTSQIPEMLKYVEIISVSDSNGYDVGNNASSSNQAKTVGSTVTFLVNEIQAKLLADLELKGDIHLSLVYRGNDERKQELIRLQNDYIKTLYPEQFSEELLEEELKSNSGIVGE